MCSPCICIYLYIINVCIYIVNIIQQSTNQCISIKINFPCVLSAILYWYSYFSEVVVYITVYIYIYKLEKCYSPYANTYIFIIYIYIHIHILIHVYIYIYIHMHIYPPTPADARGSAPGNKTSKFSRSSSSSRWNKPQ